jgi:signal peptidase II
VEARLKRNLRAYFWLIFITAMILILDQWTKWLVRTNLEFGGMWSPFDWLTPYARIVHWYNTGVAFGMFQGMGWVFAILAFIISIFIIYFYGRVPLEDWPLRLALILQLSGALGNFIDRITIGHVTDFISVGNFAVFNVADSCITVGVIVMILGFWYMERKEKKLREQQQPSGEKENPVQ